MKTNLLDMRVLVERAKTIEKTQGKIADAIEEKKEFTSELYTQGMDFKNEYNQIDAYVKGRHA